MSSAALAARAVAKLGLSAASRSPLLQFRRLRTFATRQCCEASVLPLAGATAHYPRKVSEQDRPLPKRFCVGQPRPDPAAVLNFADKTPTRLSRCSATWPALGSASRPRNPVQVRPGRLPGIIQYRYRRHASTLPHLLMRYDPLGLLNSGAMLRRGFARRPQQG